MQTRLAGALVLALSVLAVLAAPAPAAVFPISDPPQVVGGGGEFALLDFDGDGYIDIAGVREVDSSSSQAYLLRGTASGFAPIQTVELPMAAGRLGVVAADLSADGCDELIVTFDWTARLVVLRGNRNARLAAPAAADVYPIGAPDLGYPRLTAVDAADVDGDGDVDIVAALGSSTDFNRPADPSEGGRVTVFTNDSSGALAPTAQVLSVNAPGDLMLVALAGDTDPELIVAQTNKPGDTSLKIFAGDSGAFFGSSTEVGAGRNPFQLAQGDFDRDGRVDIVVGHRNFDVSGTPLRDPASILRGLATPAALGSRIDVPDALGSMVAVADLDRDGQDDLYIADGRPPVPFTGATDDPIFLHGLGDFAFGRGLQPQRPWEFNEHGPQVADVDRDGRLDVVTAGRTDDIHHFIRYGLGPQLRPDPVRIDFSAQIVGTRTNARALRFINEGPGIATGIRLLSDGATADFPVQDDSCTGATLRVGDSCIVRIAFAPSAAQQRFARVAMRAADADSTLFSELIGTGVKPASAPATGPPTVTSTTRAGLVRRGLRFRQRIRRPGRIRWTLELAAGDSRSATTRAVIVARAVRTVGYATTVRLTLRLTPIAKRLLNHRRATRLVLRSTFTDADKTRFRTVTTVRLRH